MLEKPDLRMGDPKDHPGYAADTCPHRLTINAHPMGTSSNGFACRQTGGHCLPGTQKCPAFLTMMELKSSHSSTENHDWSNGYDHGFLDAMGTCKDEIESLNRTINDMRLYFSER